MWLWRQNGVAASLHLGHGPRVAQLSSGRFVPSADPFADATKGDDLLPAGTEDYIHIRIQQRNGRKTLTTVQGIADDYDKKKLVKAFKKVERGSGGARQRSGKRGGRAAQQDRPSLRPKIKAGAEDLVPSQS